MHLPLQRHHIEHNDTEQNVLPIVEVGGNQPIQLPYITYGHPFIAASWYYANGLCRCPYGCWRMLDRLISTHPDCSTETCSLQLGIVVWTVAFLLLWRVSLC
jgi:hypothetical protein